MSETFDDLSAFSRQELYSIINTLKREINCLSTDLLRLQLLANKYQKYTKYLETKPNKSHINYKYIREINVLKVCNNCFIGLNQLNANHFQSDNLNENNVSKGCRERSDELVENNEDINGFVAKEEADDMDINECNINYVSNEVIINDSIDDSNECDVNIRELQSTDENINVSNDGLFVAKKLNTNQEIRLEKQRSGSVDRESVVDDYNGSDSDYKPEEVEYRKGKTSPKKNIKMSLGPQKPRSFKCDVDGCGKSYLCKISLRFHQKSHQRSGRYYCDRPDCRRHFGLQIKLQRHLKSNSWHLLSDAYLCGHNNECLFKTKSRQELDAHFAAEHPSDAVELKPCGWKGCEYVFLRPGDAETHMHRHWRTSGTECGFCLITFPTTDLLLEHRAVKHVTTYRCDQCEYETENKFLLSKHRATHRSEKSYKCSLNGCLKKFKGLAGLTNHQMTKHVQEFPSIPWIDCPKCIFRTKSVIIMKQHNRRPCPKRFTNKRRPLTTNKTGDDNNDNEDNDKTNAKRKHSGSDDCHKNSDNLVIDDNSGSDEEYKPEKELKVKKFVPKKRQKTKVSTGAGKKYRCSSCDFVTDRNPEMFAHRVRQHASEKQIVCKLGVGCRRKFRNGLDLRKHQLFRHPEEFPDVPWLECPQPNCTFRTKTNQRLNMHLVALDAHRTVVSKPITKISYVCDWIGCGRRCVSEATMTAHRRIHTMDNEMDCVCDHPGCEESFSKPNDLREHKLTLHATTYRCGADGCPFVTGLVSALKEHFSDEHTGQRPPVLCGINGCDKVLAIGHPQAHQYRSHPEAFPEVPWIECTEQDCTFRSKYKWSMFSHTKSHTKPYRCDVCDRAFGTKLSRDEHLRTHNDDLKLKCDWYGCEARFTTDDARKDHFNTHTEATIYRCEWPGCDKTFIHRTSLAHHKRTHRSQSTTTNSQVMSNLSNWVVHRCHWPECEFETRYEKSLNRHIDSQHKGLRTSATKSVRKKPKRKRKRW